MHLKEVTINGFKSFADKTRLDLEPGVIAVVGPNGCGKSNIADALRWVLGEQSAKAMRGDKMQDVIFAGSERRKALNLCEVSLKFTNCEDKLGTAFNEVEVGRRVAREGSSDYFINGKTCRLKDIQRLFMDTGVGRVSYSFLLQGQIDQILSSNPSERRVIFEEAAGITKYKAQRRETLNKLNLVEANLARVTDVIDEVGRQIGSLKRQASKALRYQRLQHRLSHLDLAWLAFHYDQRAADLEKLKAEEQALGSELKTQRDDLSEKEAQLSQRREERTASRERLQSAQQALFDLKNELERNQNKIRLSEARQTDLGERREKLNSDLNAQHERRAQIEAQLENENTSRQMQLDLVGDSDAIFQERNREVLIAQDNLGKAEKELKAARQEGLMVENALTRLRSNVTTLEVELKGYQGRHAQLSETVHVLEKEIEHHLHESHTLEDAHEARAQEITEAEAALSQLSAERKEQRAVYADKQSALQKVDKQIAAVTAHLGVLEKLNQGHEGLGAGAKALLQGKVSEFSIDGAEPLSSSIEVEESDRPAIEALLGASVDTVLAPSFAAAAAAVDGLIAAKLGTAVVRGDNARAVPFSVPNDLPEGVRPAFPVVKSQSARAENHLRAMLAGCYLVADLEAFRSYWSAQPEFRFARAVDPSGRVFNADGSLQGGKGKGEKSSVIQRQADIKRRKTELSQLRGEMDTLSAERGSVDQKVESIEHALERQRGQLSELKQEFTTIQAQRRSLQANLTKAQDGQQKAKKALEAFEATHSRQQEALIQARAALGKGEADQARIREKVDASEAAILRFREERDARRDSLADLRLQLAEKRQKLETIDREVSQMKRRLDEAGSLIRQWEMDRDNLIEQIGKFTDDVTHATARRKHLTESVELTEAQVKRQDQAVVALEDEVGASEKALESLRRNERELADRHSKLEVRTVEISSKLQALIERATGDYERDLSKIGWKSELWKANAEFEKQIDLEALEDVDSIEELGRPVHSDPTEEDLAALEATDWTAIESEVRELRSRVGSMGPVNLVAIKEYADLAQRYQFLKEQSEDLWESKNTLIEAIDEINTISTQLFRDTFEQVTQNFKYTYDQLTGGGFADLQLVDEGDVLDSGIEIIARPPGTRLKSLSLLSGGQKTMTAVALLFAIYMVKPSPFCVLDELDAPLDDANIGRFTEMLKSFTRYSQFVIITHNKRTIAASNIVYGVTMPEKGVSRLVSMRFKADDDGTKS